MIRVCALVLLDPSHDRGGTPDCHLLPGAATLYCPYFFHNNGERLKINDFPQEARYACVWYSS